MKDRVRTRLHGLFDLLNLEVKDESERPLQFFLRYEAPERSSRNTLKLEILDKRFRNGQYTTSYFEPIDRSLKCQTLETIFANKLVALIARYDQTGRIAGRDLYDINHFFKKVP